MATYYEIVSDVASRESCGNVVYGAIVPRIVEPGFSLAKMAEELKANQIATDELLAKWFMNGANLKRAAKEVTPLVSKSTKVSNDDLATVISRVSVGTDDALKAKMSTKMAEGKIIEFVREQLSSGTTVKVVDDKEAKTIKEALRGTKKRCFGKDVDD
jgi:hypothetical protein